MKACEDSVRVTIQLQNRIVNTRYFGKENKSCFFLGQKVHHLFSYLKKKKILIILNILFVKIVIMLFVFFFRTNVYSLH